ncbi:MAG TPA: translesion DNA synthesis-associated protein ImuA [Burkholderiaceae bacterium]|nr:translesion DNA synthesis-associated protein ImuA [Burkholderiaceae bacterium]
MRAATELLSLLQTAGSVPLWRADEVEDAGGPALASGFAELDRELPGGGWPQGQLIELLTDDAGIGELSLLAPALASLAQARRCTVWVLPVDASSARATVSHVPEAQAIPYAPALATAGLDLARTIFVKPSTPREGLWAVEQSLRARHLGAVVGWLPAASGDGDFRALRRLHLLAQRHQALAFVLRPARQAQAPSPAVLRLHLASAGAQLEVTLLKRRGRPLLEPVTLALRPAHWESARVDADTAPRVLPASAALLDAQRPLDALLT